MGIVTEYCYLDNFLIVLYLLHISYLFTIFIQFHTSQTLQTSNQNKALLTQNSGLKNHAIELFPTVANEIVNEADSTPAT